MHVDSFGMHVDSLGMHVDSFGMHVDSFGMHVDSFSMYVDSLVCILTGNKGFDLEGLGPYRPTSRALDRIGRQRGPWTVSADSEGLEP